MSSNKWKKIFGKKSQYINKNPYNLMSYSLFTQVYSNEINYSDFLLIMKFISKGLLLKKNKSILDYGSGNGAMLFYFLSNFSLKKNISIEINNFFLNFQKKFINNTKFLKVNFFNSISLLRRIKNNSVDSVMCNSVFQYFFSDDQATQTLLEFIRISKKRVFIYDVKNKEMKKEYQEVVRKRQGLSKLQFDKKYLNTPIRTYNKSFFFKNEKLNKIIKFIKIYPMPKCALDNKFGFCVMIEKN